MAADGTLRGLTAGGGDSVLKRRLARTVAEAAQHAGGAVAQAWEMALRRSAQDMLALRLDVTSCRLRRLSLTELLELPGSRALIGVLDGPAEAMGIIVLSPDVLSALVEVQTIGAVSAQPALARKPTRTDAAMVADFFDSALSDMELGLAGQPEIVWAGGFRYASFLDDPRPLGLMLEDAAWQVVEAEVSLAGGVKTGRVMLALPAEGRGAGAALQAHAAEEAAFTADLAQQIAHAQAQLHAVLARVSVDLKLLMDLGVEDVLPLAGCSLQTVTLETPGARRVAIGQLGQARGMRALRILQIEGELPGHLPSDPQLAAAHEVFTTRGSPPTPHKTEETADDLGDPSPMAELMSGLDLGDTAYPPLSVAD
jgi:flagellar motor switch protein FliM